MHFLNLLPILCFCLLVIFTFVFLNNSKEKKEFDKAKFISRVGMFSAISTILYIVPIFQIKLPFFPSFLELHFDEIPAFICGFAYGPLSAFCVICIKTIIKLPFSTTLLVGEFCDLLLSIVYVIPACLIYEKIRNKKGVYLGFTISTCLQFISALFINIFISIPFYLSLFGMADNELLYVVNLVIPSVKNLSWSYGLYCVIPFNLLKDFLVFGLTFIIYRKIHFLLRYEGRKGIKKAD